MLKKKRNPLPQLYNKKKGKKIKELSSDGSFYLLFNYFYVDGSQFTAILRILFGVKCNFLTFLQGFKAVGDDSGEVNEHVAFAIIVGNESITFF